MEMNQVKSQVFNFHVQAESWQLLELDNSKLSFEVFFFFFNIMSLSCASWSSTFSEPHIMSKAESHWNGFSSNLCDELFVAT